MAWSNWRFSVRDFLRDREALLVHFSTPYTSHPDLSFPDDLKRGATLQNETLSFSTVLKDDRGPYQGDVHPEDANAQGCIGLVVDIAGNDCVTAVAAGDYGVQFDLTTQSVVMSGGEPSLVECARSIDERRSANDWRVKNYVVLGLFVFEPALAFRRLGDVVIEMPVGLDDILSEFPEVRIFSTRKERFAEYDRAAGAWMPSTYGKIVPLDPSVQRSAKRRDAQRCKPKGQLLR